MSKKRNRIIIWLFVGIVFALASFLIAGKMIRNKKAEKAAATRYELVADYARRSGLSNHLQESPYADVQPTDEYYNEILAAYGWGYLPNTEMFEGDKRVNGHYLAVFATRTIGEDKLAIMTSDEDGVLTDEECYEWAIAEGLVPRNAAERLFNLEECRKVLYRAADIAADWHRYYQGEVFEYDVADGVQFSDVSHNGIVYNSKEDPAHVNVSDRYDAGSVLLLEDSGLKYLKKVLTVTETDEGYCYEIEDADPLEVFENLTVKSAMDCSLSEYYDIFKDSGRVLAEGRMDSANLEQLQLLLEEMERKPITEGKDEAFADKLHDLFSVEPMTVYAADDLQDKGDTGLMIHFGEGLLDIVWLANGLELKVALPDFDAAAVKTNLSNDLDFYLYVKNLSFSKEIEVKNFSLQKLDVCLDLELNPVLSYAAGITFSKQTDLKFAKIPLPGGICSLGLNFGFTLDLTGSANLSVNLPIHGEIKYTKENGFSMPPSEQGATVAFFGKMEGELKLYPILQFELFQTLVVFDVEPFGGAYATIEQVEYPDSDLKCRRGYICPIAGIMCCGAGNSDETLLGKLVDKYDLTLYLLSPYRPAENMSGKLYKRVDYHAEKHPGDEGYSEVPECTYGGSEEGTLSNGQEIDPEALENFWKDIKSLAGYLYGMVPEGIRNIFEDAYDTWHELTDDKEFESEDDTAVYKRLLNYYYYGVKYGHLDSSPHDFGIDNMETFGYAFADINGDGQSELIFGRVGSAEDAPFYIMYTADADKNISVLHESTEESFQYLLHKDVTFHVVQQNTDEGMPYVGANRAYLQQIYYTPISHWKPNALYDETLYLTAGCEQDGDEAAVRLVTLDPGKRTFFGTITDIKEYRDPVTGELVFCVSFDEISGYKRSDVRHTHFQYENVAILMSYDATLQIYDWSIGEYIVYPVSDAITNEALRHAAYSPFAMDRNTGYVTALAQATAD